MLVAVFWIRYVAWNPCAEVVKKASVLKRARMASLVLQKIDVRIPGRLPPFDRITRSCTENRFGDKKRHATAPAAKNEFRAFRTTINVPSLCARLALHGDCATLD